MKDHSEKGSKMEKSPNKEKIQFYKVYNQLRQHDDFIDDIVYDVDKLTQKASLYYKKINSIIDDIISSIKQDLLAGMDKNNPPKFDLERISEAFQNKWAEHKTIAEENQKRIYIEATNLIKEHADAMQQEGGYSDEDKVKDILVRRQKLKDRVKKTQEIMDKLLDSSRGGEKDKISDSERLALEKEKAYSKPLAEWNWRDRLVGSKLSVSSYGILTSDNNEGSKKEDIIDEASYIATSGDADLWESGEKPLEEVYKQYNDTIARIDRDLKAIAKSPSSSKGFERHDDNDFYVYMNKVQEGIEPLTKGSHRCFHIIDNKVNNIKMKLIRNRRDSEDWEESLKKQVDKIAKETDDLISCMKSVYSTGEDVLISKGLQYYLHIDFEASALPQKLENAKESAQKLMFEIYESALEDPSLNRQKARSQVIKQQYKMTTQALKLQENSFEKSIMDGIDHVRDQWFQCFGAAVDCVARNLLIIEPTIDSDFRLRKENNIDILKEQCARLEGSMTRLFLKGNSLLIKCEEKRNQAEQNFNALEDKELNELSGKLKVFEESIQKDMCTIFQNIFSDMRQEFLRSPDGPEVSGEFDVSLRNESRRNKDFNIHQKRDTRAADAKENNLKNDGFTKSDKDLDLGM